ncbi:MAG: patatin-like phospholipase family protein [Planctomycetaceae bacterium]
MIAATNKQNAVLALGGGGARGVAHLGVIEVLRNVPLDIDRYVGVSIGSLAGALCAVDDDCCAVQTKVVDYLTSAAFQHKQAELFLAAPEADEPAVSGLFAWYYQIRKYIGARRKLAQLFSKPALLEASVMREVVDALLPDIDIKDTHTPISIVALDLYSGKKVELTTGSLRNAVMASAAIPGVFPPVKWDDMLLCDVGMMDAIPAKLAKSYAKGLTIAVDVSGIVEPIDKCETAGDIFLRLYDIGEPLIREYTRSIADLLIRPDVSHMPWYDFSDPAGLIQLGRDAARSYLVSRGESTVRPALSTSR